MFSTNALLVFELAAMKRSLKPSLWGGYAGYHCILDPHTVMHKVSKSIPAEQAVMFNPLGAESDGRCRCPGPLSATRWRS